MKNNENFSENFSESMTDYDLLNGSTARSFHQPDSEYRNEQNDEQNDERTNEFGSGSDPEAESGSRRRFGRRNPMDPNDRERSGRLGFGTGVFAGLALGVLVFVVGLRIFCNTTGSQLIFGSHGVSNVETTKVLDQETIDKMDELISYMDLYYYEEYDVDELRDSILGGMVDGIGDKYSVYYTAEEYADQQVSTSGTYYGIGAGLIQDTDTMQVSISRIYEGTPSDEAGLLKDDIILTVDGVDATSMEVTDLVKLIRGEEGTTVYMEVYRPSTEETLEFDVERKNVELPSVTSQMLSGNIGYLQITEFQTNTAKQFQEALNSLEDQGMESLVIDLRSNPGGLVSSVVEILDIILPEGLVVYVEDKYGNRKDYTSSGSSVVDYPMCVLVDGASASSAEIFAGAIKDYEYGTIIGTTTFGKGIVQTIYPLSDGDAIKITTAKYFTPNGNYIHGEGITPDVELEYEFLGGEEDEYAVEFDNQIQKAVELLQQ